MPKASEIATELRKIADALDKEPETDLVRPMLSFYNNNRKDQFLATARLLPRPFKKEVGSYAYTIESTSIKAVWLRSSAGRSAVCTIVKPAQPAVYDCEPLLSEMEESSLT